MTVALRPTLSRFAALAYVAFAAAGCIETGFGTDLPAQPSSNPPSVPNAWAEDRVVQVTTPEVDVLFVIDNSCSMQADQDNLAQNFPSFLEFFRGSGLDYHIGVTSTDIDDSSRACSSGGNPLKGRLQDFQGQRWVEENTPQPEIVFGSMVSMGTSGSGCEQGLNAAFLNLEQLRGTYNAGFYRDDASIHTVVVSDEQDQSEMWGSNYITLGEFKNWYDGLKDVVEDRTFSAVVCTEPTGGYDGCPQENVGSRYMEVSNNIGGIIWDLQDENFSELLEQLGVQASGFKREYFLSQIPVPETLQVQIEQQNGAIDVKTQGDLEAGGEYYYDEGRNSIVFYDFVPEPLDTIVIRYILLSASQDPSYGTDVTQEIP